MIQKTKATPFPKRNGAAALPLYGQSVNNEFLYLREKFGSVIGMSLKLDRLGKVKAENTHNGLGVYRISARNKVNIVIALGYNSHKALDVVDSA